MICLLFKLSLVYRYTVNAVEDYTAGPSSLTTRLASSDTMNTMKTVTEASPPPSHPPPEALVCHEGLCSNGGTCHQLQLAGRTLPSCHCPLHFTGTLCEKGTWMLFFFPHLAFICFIQLRTLPAALWPPQWYQQEPANKLCFVIYAESLWLIGFAVRSNRVSCIKNFERCELFSIWLMKLEIYISSLNHCCVSTFASRAHSEWECNLAALVQHSANTLTPVPSKNIYRTLYQPLGH